MAGGAEAPRVEAGQATTRVRYPETDRMGIAHHTHYLVWFELGRTEWLRALGVPYARLEEEDGIFLPVVEASAAYREPARYDDTLRILTRLAWLRPVRMRLDYTIERQTDGRILATGHTVHACVTSQGRPRRIPETLMRRLREVAEGRS